MRVVVVVEVKMGGLLLCLGQVGQRLKDGEVRQDVVCWRGVLVVVLQLRMVIQVATIRIIIIVIVIIVVVMLMVGMRMGMGMMVGSVEVSGGLEGRQAVVGAVRDLVCQQILVDCHVLLVAVWERLQGMRVVGRVGVDWVRVRVGVRVRVHMVVDMMVREMVKGEMAAGSGRREGRQLGLVAAMVRLVCEGGR